MRLWAIWTLKFLPFLLFRADGKGGSGTGGSGTGGSGTGGRGYGSYSGTYYGVGGGVLTSRAAFASAGAFGAVVLVTSGSRRRYGSYNDPEDSSQCQLLTEEEMRSACLNLIGNETLCHDCIACGTEDCMYGISNCDEYLSTVFRECCVSNCDGGGGPGGSGAIVAIVAVLLCVVCGGGFAGFRKLKPSIMVHPESTGDPSAQHVRSTRSVSGKPSGPNPSNASKNDPSHMQGQIVGKNSQIVQGQVVAIGAPTDKIAKENV